jgi:hypothetical protein
MAKKHNHGTAWTREEVKALRQLAKENAPTRVIGIKLGRSEASIQGRHTRFSIQVDRQQISSTRCHKEGFAW